MKNIFKKNIIMISGLALGMIGGFLYWRFVGCVSGTCPLTSNWIIMLIYGGIMGALIGNLIQGFTKKTTASEKE